MGERNDGEAEERDAESATVEPYQALADVVFRAGLEGFEERLDRRVGTIVCADEDGERGGAEHERHYEGKVDGEPYQRWVFG